MLKTGFLAALRLVRSWLVARPRLFVCLPVLPCLFVFSAVVCCLFVELYSFLMKYMSVRHILRKKTGFTLLPEMHT
jgi:hypothetical protein